MTAVLDPLVEVPDYPPSDPAFAGHTMFVDGELAERPPADDFVFMSVGPVTITLPASGSYAVAVSGSYTITHLAPSRPARNRRFGDARELTPELIEAAAALMERVGLHKGDLWPGVRAVNFAPPAPYEAGQPVCAWGALLVASGVTELTPMFSLDKVLWDEHMVLDNIAVYNDDPVRTKAEVVEQLRHRARMLRQLQAA